MIIIHNVATVILNGQDPGIPWFIFCQLCDLVDNFFLRGCVHILALLIDKANKIGRPNAQFYCLTPSELDFTAI